MNVGILGKRGGWHTTALQAACGRRGITATVLPITRLIARLSHGAVLSAGEERLDRFDAIFVRAIPGGSLEQIIFRMDALARDDSRKGEVVKIESGLDPSKIRAKFIEKVKEEVVGIKLEDAAVVVSGGRGMGEADNFKYLQELADILHGAIGASRPPCDSGWVPASIQVGLTGKIVSPTLYIAVGISGAAQHISGMSGAKNIIAINKDAEANIFKVAHIGVVGDWKKVLPAFTEKVKELVG